VVIGGAVAQAASIPIIIRISETENRRLNIVFLLLLEWAQPVDGNSASRFRLLKLSKSRHDCGGGFILWQQIMPAADAQQYEKATQIFWGLIYRFEILGGDSGSPKQTIPSSVKATPVKSPRSRLVFIAKHYSFVKLKIAF
jgi:hypothetical protein